jgi:formate-dependent nitrite reductase membrane component NrfD
LFACLSFLSFLNFYLWLPERFELLRILEYLTRRFPQWKIVRALQENRFLARWRRENLNGLRGWTGLVGIAVALLVGIYTGVLLGALVARPFWNNPMLPMLFLVSALKTGTASVLLGGFMLRYVVVYAGQVARVIAS